MKHRLTAFLLCLLMAVTFMAEAVHTGHHHDHMAEECPVCEMMRTRPETEITPAAEPAVAEMALPAAERVIVSAPVHEAFDSLQKMNVRFNS